MTQEERKYYTLAAMRRFGGSFVQALAECAERADPANLQKIKETWSLYWETYDKMGWRMWQDDQKDGK